MAARTTHTFKLESGEEIGILYTNRALANAEAETSKNLLALLNSIASGNLSINDISILLKVGMEAYRRDVNISGKPVTIDDSYRVMDEIGFSKVSEAVLTSVADVLNYNSGLSTSTKKSGSKTPKN